MKVRRLNAGDKNASDSSMNKALYNAIKMQIYRSGQQVALKESQYHTKKTTENKLRNKAKEKIIRRYNSEQRRRNTKRNKKKETIISQVEATVNNEENRTQMNLAAEEN